MKTRRTHQTSTAGAAAARTVALPSGGKSKSPPPQNLDTDLLARCADFTKADELLRHLNAKGCPSDDVGDAALLAWYAAMAPVAATTPQTKEGLLAKGAIAHAVIAHTLKEDHASPETSREEYLALTALGEMLDHLSQVRGIPEQLDAELIRVCAEHAVNAVAYDTAPDGGTLDYDNDPLWQAYSRSRDFISAARPKTLAGMQAKARAAKVEARGVDGSDKPDGSMGEIWAWDLVNDLLGGEGA